MMTVLYVFVGLFAVLGIVIIIAENIVIRIDFAEESVLLKIDGIAVNTRENRNGGERTDKTGNGNDNKKKRFVRLLLKNTAKSIFRIITVKKIVFSGEACEIEYKRDKVYIEEKRTDDLFIRVNISVNLIEVLICLIKAIKEYVREFLKKREVLWNR